MTRNAEALPAALHEGPIEWSAWSEEAFRKAGDEDKLVLVDVGAVWCHWCHVMDRTTYDDEQVAAIVRDKFIAIRVDRDQRPDIDARLQRAVPLIRSQANGWPLTVVLTPAGHVLFKATYLPPVADSRLGIGFGMADLLDQLDKVYRQRREELQQAGQELADQLRDALRQSVSKPGAVDDDAVSKLARGIVRQFDAQFGGFGAGDGPKFPHTSAADLCLILGKRNDDSALLHAATETLFAMARGGIHDHLAGGFHRYSVDRYWRVPHFEKMAADNAALLANYARAFAATGDAQFRQTAEGILRFTSEVLYDHAEGGFWGSQDADIDLHDDGAYFTWTPDQVRHVLVGEELDAAVSYFDIRDSGDMPAEDSLPAGRNVLAAGKTVEQLARMMKLESADLTRRLDSAKAKLLAERRLRPTPWVDKTIFADWNGAYIRSCCLAYKLIGQDAGTLDMATRAADRLIRQFVRSDGLVRHHIESPGPRASGSTDRSVFGQLADHAWVAWGLLGLYSITGRSEYLDTAVRLLEHVVTNLSDPQDGGFMDSPAESAGDSAGPLAVRQRHKPWEDTPTQSPNSIACLALLEAWQYTGRAEFADAARKAVESFAGAATPEIALFVAGWALAADMLLHPPAHVLIVGPADSLASMLHAAWTASVGSTGFQPVAGDTGWKPVLPGSVLTEPLDSSSPAAAERLKKLGVTRSPASDPDEVLAYVCQGTSCRPPVRTREELLESLGGM